MSNTYTEKNIIDINLDNDYQFNIGDIVVFNFDNECYENFIIKELYIDGDTNLYKIEGEKSGEMIVCHKNWLEPLIKN